MDFSLGLNLNGALDKTNAVTIKNTTAAIDYASVKRVILASISRTLDQYNRFIALYEDDIARLQPADTVMRRRQVAALEKSIDQYKELRRLLRARWTNLDLDNYLTRMTTIPGLKRIWGEDKPSAPLRLSNHPYLCAQTQTVILEHRWDMGEYTILIPLGGDVTEMHWIPNRQPTATNRHPHHGVDREGIPHTCLGSFRQLFDVALEGADAVTLLNLCVRYINSFDAGSQLYHISYNLFKQPVQR